MTARYDYKVLKQLLVYTAVNGEQEETTLACAEEARRYVLETGMEFHRAFRLYEDAAFNNSCLDALMHAVQTEAALKKFGLDALTIPSSVLFD